LTIGGEIDKRTKYYKDMMKQKEEEKKPIVNPFVPHKETN